ncbi:MAG TPA: DUF2269 family protein [Baekduia sp.]|nr:DUF2269 family protein [Baekduia sp.]
MLAITFYSVVLSVHIMAVVVAFGTSFAYPVFMPWARRNHPQAMPVIHEMSDRLGKLVMSPAIAVVLIAGIYLASDADVWSEPWVSVPLVILIVIGGLGGMFFAPNERKLSALATRDLAAGGELSAEYDDLFRRVAVAGYTVCALVLIAIFFMAAKPGA